LAVILPLDALGRRICILGRSTAGKSTLAQVLAAKLDAPAVYLDQFAFLPHSDWELRPPAEFTALHDAAIDGDAWVIEGNYSRLMPQRLERATGIILLDPPRLPALFRYIRRSLLERGRPGALEGGRDSVKWLMIRHIAFVQNVEKYRDTLRTLDLPFVDIRSMRALNQLYSVWELGDFTRDVRR
jgi:adenylate kinase family enzyme